MKVKNNSIKTEILAFGLMLLLAACGARSDAPAPVDIHGSGSYGIDGLTGQQAITVKAGESVYILAKRYGLPMEDIIRLNSLKPHFTLQVGQKLRLPQANVYVVRSGDSLSALSRMFQTDMNTLARLNNLQPPYALQVGQSLKIPGIGQEVSGQTAQFARKSNPQNRQKPSDGYRSFKEYPNAKIASKRVGGQRGNTATRSVTSNGRRNFAAAKPYGGTKGNTFNKPSVYNPSAPLAPPMALDNSVATSLETPVATENPTDTETASINMPAEPVAVPPVPLVEKPKFSTETAKPKAATNSTANAKSGNEPAPSRFVWPVQGVILSDFGAKDGGLNNDGINIAAPHKAIVRAAADGTVAYTSDNLKGFGKLILVRHGGDYVTAYAHLDRIDVAKGDSVTEGQVIGTVGRTGFVTEPQLHFEIREDGNVINPIPKLQKASGS